MDAVIWNLKLDDNSVKLIRSQGEKIEKREGCFGNSLITATKEERDRWLGIYQDSVSDTLLSAISVGGITAKDAEILKETYEKHGGTLSSDFVNEGVRNIVEERLRSGLGLGVFDTFTQMDTTFSNLITATKDMYRDEMMADIEKQREEEDRKEEERRQKEFLEKKRAELARSLLPQKAIRSEFANENVTLILEGLEKYQNMPYVKSCRFSQIYYDILNSVDLNTSRFVGGETMEDYSRWRPIFSGLPEKYRKDRVNNVPRCLFYDFNDLVTKTHLFYPAWDEIFITCLIFCPSVLILAVVIERVIETTRWGRRLWWQRVMKE